MQALHHTTRRPAKQSTSANLRITQKLPADGCRAFCLPLRAHCLSCRPVLLGLPCLTLLLVLPWPASVRPGVAGRGRSGRPMGRLAGVRGGCRGARAQPPTRPARQAHAPSPCIEAPANPPKQAPKKEIAPRPHATRRSMSPTHPPIHHPPTPPRNPSAARQRRVRRARLLSHHARWPR